VTIGVYVKKPLIKNDKIKDKNLSANSEVTVLWKIK